MSNPLRRLLAIGLLALAFSCVTCTSGSAFLCAPAGHSPRAAGAAETVERPPSQQDDAGGRRSHSGSIRRYALSGGVGQPRGLAVDPNGNVWFAEPGCDFAPNCPKGTPPGQLGQIPAGSTEPRFFTLPDLEGNQPLFVTIGPEGKIWFTTPDNDMIGAFDPATSTFAQWPVTPRSAPWALAFKDSVLWYTAKDTSVIGRFDPATHTHTDFPTPSPNSEPLGIAADDPTDPNLIWFVENDGGRVGVLDTAHGNTISEYQVRAHVGPRLTLHAIDLDDDGNVWFTEGWVRAIGKLNPRVATAGDCGTANGSCIGVTEYALPAPDACPESHVSGIAAQRKSGMIWLDDSLSAQVGSFDRHSGAFDMRQLANCNAHPHDGLAIDGDDHIWWSEQCDNTISRLEP